MKKIALVFLMMIAAAGMAFAQSDLQALAIVKYNKSETITVKQLKSRCETYRKQMGKNLTTDEKKMVLKALIEEKLVLQAAAKEGLSIPDSTVDQYFMQTMQQQIGANVTEKELNDILKKTQNVTLDQLLQEQAGMNTAEYKNYLKNQLIAQQYIVSKKQAELQQVSPSNEEILAFYEANKASFVWTDMMKVFMIIVPKGNDAEAAKLKCNDLRNKYVDKKLTSDQIAVQSRAENSGYQAGDLLLPKTEAAAQSIGLPYASLLVLYNQSEGFVSQLEETDADYRIVCLGKKYSAKMLAVTDVVQPETTVTVYDYIRSNLTQQKQMQYMQIAAQEISDSLYKPEYVEEKKTGAALDKLLDWGDQ